MPRFLENEPTTGHHFQPGLPATDAATPLQTLSGCLSRLLKSAWRHALTRGAATLEPASLGSTAGKSEQITTSHAAVICVTDTYHREH